VSLNVNRNFFRTHIHETSAAIVGVALPLQPCGIEFKGVKLIGKFFGGLHGWKAPGPAIRRFHKIAKAQATAALVAPNLIRHYGKSFTHLPAPCDRQSNRKCLLSHLSSHGYSTQMKDEFDTNRAPMVQDPARLFE
jgi:hypothetical protein